jgi:hypothetical protein
MNVVGTFIPSSTGWLRHPRIGLKAIKPQKLYMQTGNGLLLYLPTIQIFGSPNNISEYFLSSVYDIVHWTTDLILASVFKCGAGYESLFVPRKSANRNSHVIEMESKSDLVSTHTSTDSETLSDKVYIFAHYP